LAIGFCDDAFCDDASSASSFFSEGIWCDIESSSCKQVSLGFEISSCKQLLSIGFEFSSCKSIGFEFSSCKQLSTAAKDDLLAGRECEHPCRI
jgi:hypothetical protein